MDMQIPWNERVYALYKGERFLIDGTILEISKETNKSLDWLRYMLTPSYEKKRENSINCLRLIQLDDED
ncbi:hypothetical protein ABR776_27210 [Bacillus cereus]|uniref:Uncharacterized protein n=2 Tax=Bacillus TaxID=1386 RepID=A0A1Q4L0K5_BACCE|nr:hypothetical protein [Bacillus mobilis]OKA27347.1 hypothetical protein BJR06_30005 [Bacillus cereus]OKA30501.1 hypothetical protein BJR07_29990 [Bacillus cereus]OKA31433.1 hypothetical protein BJR07_29640 [Bacillus cereus]HDR7784935.1 hypothetical protein [Bacillus wiedmannii]